MYWRNGVVCLLVLMLSITSFGCSNEDEQVVTDVNVVKINDYIIDPQGQNFSSGKFRLNPNSAIHAQDMMVTFNNYQYIAYYNRDSDGKSYVNLARRKLSSDTEWDVITFTDYEYKSDDSHNTVVLGISRADGTIHLAFDHHASNLNYRVSQQGVATNPDNVEWNKDLFGSVNSQLVPGQTEKRVTYPRFIDVPNGNLQLIYRKGGSGNGDTILYTYDGVSNHTWTKNGVIISGEGDYKGSPHRNAYLNHPQYFDDKLYLTWVWREEPDAMSNHDLMFAYSEDYGITWKNNDGNVIATAGSNPMNISTSGLIAWTIDPNHGLLNQGYSYVDKKGRVHVILSHAPEDNPDYASWSLARSSAKYVHYWRGTDNVWNQNVMPLLSVGSRPQILLDDNYTAYMVFVQNNKVRIAAATSANLWDDWKLIYTDNDMDSYSPSVDFQRWKIDGILSLLAQEIPSPRGTPSVIRGYDYSFTTNFASSTEN